MITMRKKYPDWRIEVPIDYTVILVGLGGAGSLAPLLSKLGIGHLILIDPKQSYSDTNMVTQYSLAQWQGQPKAEMLGKVAADLLRISNPDGKVSIFQKGIEEVDFNKLLKKGDNKKTILIANTDCMPAQIRCFKLAFEHQIKAIYSSSFKEGVAGEVGFYLEGETPACLGCLNYSRLERFYRGEEVAETSYGGSPVSAEALNLATARLVEAMMFRNSPKSSWFNYLDQFLTRNCFVVGLEPTWPSEYLQSWRLKFLARYFQSAQAILPMNLRTTRRKECFICGNQH